MKKESCEVIRDLLPLYEDGVASEEAQAMVRDHLKDCPACREELRKMRTPISLPPEQDRELWGKYIQRRTEIQRKRRKKLSIAAAVLAVIVLACLWYTRPQRWTDIAGAQKVDNLAALLRVDDTDFTAQGMAKFQSKVWQLAAKDTQGAATEAILHVLDSFTYRASLRSLIPRGSYSSKGATDFILLGIVWEDQSYISFNFSSNGEMTIGSDIGWDIYHIDPALFDALAAVLQEYGTLQD